jgi:hypothetical protein
LPEFAGRTHEKDESSINQIERRNALAMPLDPHVRQPRTGLRGELAGALQQLDLCG